MHARRTPARNVFRYPVSYWLLDLDELPELERRLRPVLRQPAQRRHASATATTSTATAPLKQAVLDLAGDPTVERVLLLTQLRVLGYVFNPVSFYWCYRARRLARLHRRGAEQHVRRAAARGAARAGARVTSTRKRLHVSPFFGLDQSYEYAFSQPGDEVWARIHVRDDDGARPLTAILHGRRRELTNASARPTARALPAPADAGDRPHPLAGAPALAEARAVPPQAAVRAGRGLGAHERRRAHAPPRAARRAAASSGARRSPSSTARSRSSRAARSRSTLPDGTRRRFGDGRAGRAARSTTGALFRRLATRGKLGLGESYMAGEWDVRRPRRALRAPAPRTPTPPRGAHPRLRRLLDARPAPNRRNGLLRARRNIAYHYDLGNELFALMLDETMTYSCAIFERPDEPLEDAQRRKLRRICERLQLEPGDRVLEIGCGWGGFALFAAARVRLRASPG